MFIAGNNAIQQNQPTPQTSQANSPLNTQFLGFLYSLTSHQFFCGVVLVAPEAVLADGTCVSSTTDLSEIRVYFKVYSQENDRPNYGVCGRIEVPHTIVNLIILKVSSFTQIKDFKLKS